MSKAKIHALYKGDELLMVGTVKEISAKTGLTHKSVEKLKRPSYIKRLKENHNAKILIVLDDE